MSHRGRLCQKESVRLKITEHMTSVGEEILCVLDKQLRGDVCSVQIILRVFVLERLGAAADFMFNLFQRETETLETLLERRNKLLDAVSQPHVKLHRADVLHPPVSKDKEEKSPSLVQEKPEPLHFKEELRQRPEEANRSTLTHNDDENPETKPVASTSTYHLRTQADVEGCGTSQPTSDDQLLSSDCSESEDSEESDCWEDTREALKEHSYSRMRNTHSALNSLKPREKRNVEGNDNEPSKDLEYSPRRSHTGRKSFSCTYCDKTFKTNNRLKRHTMIHTGDKPFTCGKGFIRMWCLKDHATIHKREKPLSCEMSGKASTSTEHMQTQADVEGCGASQPTNDDQLLPSHCSESEDGDVWEETSEGRSALNTLQSHDQTKTLLGQNKSLSSKLSQDVKSSKLTQTTEHGTVKRRFTCTVCGKGFRHMSHLKEHTRTHTGEKTFTCTVCGKRFVHKSSLRNHTRTHTGEKPFTCTLCGKRFKGKDGLNKHTRIHRPIEERGKPFICTVCGKGCSNIKSHMRTHTGEKPFTCTICDNAFADRGTLRKHNMTHTGEKPFTCTICGRRFAHSGHLKKHKMTHTGEKPFTCTVCGKGFRHMSHLKDHTRTHTGEKTFTCTVCGKRFVHKSSLRNHTRTHTGEKPFTCTLCGKRFKGKDGLNKHARMHRPIEERGKPFICTVCGKGCSNIKSHMRTHTGEKPFTCTICDNAFADRGTLKKHNMTHTGEKPFTCTICGKGFAHSGHLKKHKMTHTGEKPFTCTVCGKGVHHLKRHMRTHADTGEKPFTCTVCGKGITNLKRHMLTHTGDTVSPAINQPHPAVE